MIRLRRPVAVVLVTGALALPSLARAAPSRCHVVPSGAAHSTPARAAGSFVVTVPQVVCPEVRQTGVGAGSGSVPVAAQGPLLRPSPLPFTGFDLQRALADALAAVLVGAGLTAHGSQRPRKR